MFSPVHASRSATDDANVSRESQRTLPVPDLRTTESGVPLSAVHPDPQVPLKHPEEVIIDNVKPNESPPKTTGRKRGDSGGTRSNSSGSSSLSCQSQDLEGSSARKKSKMLLNSDEDQKPVTGKGRLRKYSHEPFPKKLHRLLQDLVGTEEESIAFFSPNGLSFQIAHIHRFMQEIIPRYFPRQSRYGSFKRQLCIYRFERRYSGSDEGAYYHENFQRDRPELCELMQPNGGTATPESRPRVDSGSIGESAPAPHQRTTSPKCCNERFANNDS